MSLIPQALQSPIAEKNGKVTLDWLLFFNSVLTWVPAPAAGNSPGTQGQLAYDQAYVYVCVQKNTWLRLALTSFTFAQLWAALSGTLSNGQVIPWADAGISRLAAASLAVGNGAAADFTGALKLQSILVTDTAPNADLTVQNTTPSTGAVGQASPVVTISGTSWLVGGSSAVDSWTIQKLAANATDVSSLVIKKTTPTGVAGNAVCIQAPFFCGNGTPIGSSVALGTSFALWDPSPVMIVANSNTNTHPTGQWRQVGSGQSVFWGLGSAQYTNGDQFEIYGGAGTGVSTCVLVIAPTTANLGIGRGNVSPSSTLHVYDAKAASGATQLLVQGGAAAADATSNELLRVNTGGGTALAFSVTGAGKGTMAKLKVTGLQVFANNAAAVTGGLAVGDFYRTGADPDPVCVVH